MSATALACLAPLLAHAASQDFTVINRTGFQIDSLYVGEVGRGDWGNDVMGLDKLKKGEVVNVTFDRNTGQCHWDLLVKYHDGTRAMWTDLNLCQTSRLALFWNRQTQITTAHIE